jgi:hypothetical protein
MRLPLTRRSLGLFGSGFSVFGFELREGWGVCRVTVVIVGSVSSRLLHCRPPMWVMLRLGVRILVERRRLELR